MFVVVGNVIGESVPVTVAEGCRRLGTLCECSLLGLEFDASESESWVLEAVSASPDLRKGGHELLHAMASELRVYQDNAP